MRSQILIFTVKHVSNRFNLKNTLKIKNTLQVFYFKVYFKQVTHQRSSPL
jgi:hypothetical protein